MPPEPATLTVQYKLEITSYDPVSGMALGPRVYEPETEAQANEWLAAAVSLAPQPVQGAPTRIHAVLERRVISPWVPMGEQEWLADS